VIKADGGLLKLLERTELDALQAFIPCILISFWGDEHGVNITLHGVRLKRFVKCNLSVNLEKTRSREMK